jgi:hypothetical protein
MVLLGETSRTWRVSGRSPYPAELDCGGSGISKPPCPVDCRVRLRHLSGRTAGCGYHGELKLPESPRKVTAFGAQRPRQPQTKPICRMAMRLTRTKEGRWVGKKAWGLERGCGEKDVTGSYLGPRYPRRRLAVARVIPCSRLRRENCIHGSKFRWRNCIQWPGTGVERRVMPTKRKHSQSRMRGRYFYTSAKTAFPSQVPERYNLRPKQKTSFVSLSTWIV